MKNISPLFAYACDGTFFYKAVMKRLSKLDDVSLADLCELAGINFSTSFRWKNGSKPDPDTIERVEAAFNKFERRAHTTSSSSGIKPKARL